MSGILVIANVPYIILHLLQNTLDVQSGVNDYSILLLKQKRSREMRTNGVNSLATPQNAQKLSELCNKREMIKGIKVLSNEKLTSLSHLKKKRRAAGHPLKAK